MSAQSSLAFDFPLVPAGTAYAAVDADFKTSHGSVDPFSYEIVVTTSVPECTSNADCTTADLNYCDGGGTCQRCSTSLDCPVEAPVCSGGPEGNACSVANICLNDDSHENHDDGPKGATPLAVNGTVDAMICNSLSSEYPDFNGPPEEADWYVFTVGDRPKRKLVLPRSDFGFIMISTTMP